MDFIVDWIMRIGRFLQLLLCRFIANKGLPNAAALTYTTLLSLVPLMTVGLAVFSAFPVSEKVTGEIQEFVFQNFVPASGEVVERYLIEFSSKAAKLSGVGFGFLVVVAVMMMVNIDQAINAIWRVRRKRGPISMFVMYWSILTLGPLLIGLSVAATSYLVSIPIFSDAAETLGLRHRLLAVTPLLTAIVAFTLLYSVVPNRKIPFSHALSGGVLAALLFELAKRGFAFYVTRFPTYEAIYGAMAVVPIFLVWIYLSWVVTLLGAEFSCCLGIFRDQGRHGQQGKGGDLLLAYRLLQVLWQAQADGRTLPPARLDEALGFVPEERLELLLEQLAGARLVLHSEDGGWALARDLSRVSLLDLFRVRSFVLPKSQLLAESTDTADQALGQILDRLEMDIEQAMAVSLEQLYSSEKQHASQEER